MSTKDFPRIATAFLASLLGFAPAEARAQAPTRDHDVTIDDYFGLAWVSDAAISPDGRHVVYVERRWDEQADRRNADLWVVPTSAADGRYERTRLTFDDADDEAPAWSPDGRFVYFTSDRKHGESGKAPYDGKTQVWRVGAAGGDEVVVTREAEGVECFELAHDGPALYYVVGRKNVADDPWKQLRQEFDDLQYGHGVVTAGELWKLDLESWRAEKLLGGRRVIVEMAVSPDERRIALVTRPDDTLLSNEGWSTVDVYDASTRATTTLPDDRWREQAPSPYGWIVAPCWSDDSRALAFRVDFDGYPAEVFVARFDPEGDGEVPRIVPVKRPGEVSIEGAMRWMPGTKDLAVIAEERARARVLRLRDAPSGGDVEAEVLTPGDVAVEAFGFDRGGDRAAFVTAGLDHPNDVFVTGRGLRHPVRLTKVNPQVDSWKLPSIRIVSWKSPDGTPVEGILELPPGYEPGDAGEPGRALPMVVEIHGGPTASTKYRFSYAIDGRTIFAARGWALLSPNYRGSTGYGDRFLTDLIGRENDVEVQDILAGVDAMVDRGIADPQRIAVSGWSNGGYLVNCLITRDGRFRAASSGAGVFDMAMQWSIEDTPGHVINYARGLPWDRAEEMRRMSPLYGVHRVKTPTLIHVGADDERVPAEHSRALHRALHRYLGVPSELVVYPGAGHGLAKYSHRKAKLSWDLAWFDAWVLGKPAAPANPSSPADTRTTVTSEGRRS